MSVQTRFTPIPLLMAARGYLPRWLGGEPVYEAVVRTNHFNSDTALMQYLMSQHIIAAARGNADHCHAIMRLLENIGRNQEAQPRAT